jgi:hypothetical protein
MSTRISWMLLITLAAAAAMFAWLSHSPTQKPPMAAKTQAAPVVLPPNAQAITAGGAEPRHYRPPPVTAAVRRKVDDFIRRYKDTPPAELRKNEEVREMMAGCMEGLNTPEFQRKFEERIAAIKAAKGGAWHAEH